MPVFSKDNELTVSHPVFIETVYKAAQEFFRNEQIDTPEIIVSHIIKGRIPEAIHKPVNQLLETDKTIYYERMAFAFEIPTIYSDIAGNRLNLCITGVRAYNHENLMSKKGNVKAYYDERIELMSIICHLAGFQEYNMNVGGDYITDIDNYFADVRNHPAVEMMDSLRRVNGISFDSPMAFAVNLKKAGNSFVLVNDSVAPERRWKGVDLKMATATISDFYNKSNFANFFERHKPFYEKVCSLFDSNVISKFNQSWYEQFYGVPPTDSFEVILGFTNGGGNYGPSRQLPGGPRDVYAIIGYALDDKGEPYYVSEPEMYLNTLVHEFNHSFVNPLADNPSFAPKMRLAGDAMLSYSRKVMRAIRN